MEHQDLFIGRGIGTKRPMRRRKPSRRPRRFFNREAEAIGGGILGVNPRPRPRPKPFWRPDVESELAHPKFLSRGDIERDIAGMSNKMRPKPRPMRRRRRKLWFGRPKGMRYGSKYRTNYSNFVGAEDSFLQKNKMVVLGAVALGVLFFTPFGKNLMKKMK